MRKVLVLPAVIILAGCVASCGQWKVSSLKGKKLCSIPAGSAPGNIAIDYNDTGSLNLTFAIRVFGGKIYTADNVLKRVQILEMGGATIVAIQQKEIRPAKDDDVRYTHFNFSVIGCMTVDSGGTIYVQNRLMPTWNAPKSERSDEIDFSPSYILVFDKKGNLQHTIGQRGTPDLPFYYIEKLDVDNRDRLFVISRSFDAWSVYRFNGRRRDFTATLGSADFKDVEGEDTYTGKIENMDVFTTGESFLISVAYYHGARFKYRKIFQYDLKQQALVRTVLTIPDPKNELFALVEDKHMFLWNVEERRLKLAIYNFEGNMINNVLVQLMENQYFEDVFTDESGQLYTCHVSRKGIDIMEWK